jgi:hypothetical protein
MQLGELAGASCRHGHGSGDQPGVRSSGKAAEDGGSEDEGANGLVHGNLSLVADAFMVSRAIEKLERRRVKLAGST